MANGNPKNANELASERTDLAIERTVMAANRSLMAWVRTALSMIGFGFTIYKFLQGAMKAGEVGLLRPEGPRRFGLFLIGLGVVSVVFGTIEYIQTVKRLNKQSSLPHKAFTFTVMMGMMIGLLGLLLMISILAHHEVF